MQLVENTVAVRDGQVKFVPDLKQEVKEETQPRLQECTNTVEETSRVDKG